MTDNRQLTTDNFFSILTHFQNRPQVVRATRGNPRLQVFAELLPRFEVGNLGFNFHEMPPIANRALDGYLGTMFHS